jgi:N-acetylmuramoyl-L-alanine amidase
MKRILKPIPMILVAGVTPALAEARQDLLHFHLLNSSNAYFGTPALDLPKSRAQRAPERSLITGHFYAPKMPILHPYNPNENFKTEGVDPRFFAGLEFPARFFPALPPALVDRVLQWGIPFDQVDIYCVIQDQAWNITRDQAQDRPCLQLRPNYWIHPDAPYFGVYNRADEAEAGLFATPAGVGFLGYADGDLVASKVQTHSIFDDKSQPTLSALQVSPNSMDVQGLDYRESTSFWSLVRVGGRAAATLHGLLDDEDADALSAFIPRAHTLGDLVHALDSKASGVEAEALARNLEALFRPDADDYDVLGALAHDRPELWSHGSRNELPAGRGHLETVCPCKPGEVFAGQCTVNAGGRGDVKLDMEFTDAGGEPIPHRGGPLMPRRPDHAEGLGRHQLGILGTAPEGASQVRFLLLSFNGRAQDTCRFEGVTFRQLPPPVPPAQHNLWPFRDTTLTDPGHGGQDILAKAMECGSGQVYTGRCRVRAQGFRTGRAELAIVFDTGDGTPVLGRACAPAPDLLDSSSRDGWADLEVLGTVPEGATRALLNIAAKGDPDGGARASFAGVTFHLLPEAARPNLWPYGSAADLTDPGHGGQDIKAKAFHDIQEGEVFTGEGLVRTRGFTTGQAEIGLVFDTGDGSPVLGAGQAMGPELPDRTGAAGPVRLGVQGRVPRGATRALVFVTARGEAAGGAQARFQHVACHRLPAGSPLRPNLWPFGSAVTLADPGPGGQGIKAKAMEPCRGGERFAGECHVRTEGLADGQAEIGIQFDTGDGTPVLGRAEPAGPRPARSSAPGRVALGVEGVVPPGATRALMYLVVKGNATPGARAHFEHVAFHQVAGP